MLRWELLDRATVPGGDKELLLHRRGQDYIIRFDGLDLMTSRVHGSEEALATLACEPVASRPGARVLVGGLGMGFTLSRALQCLGPDAVVEVAELVPAVVRWNRKHLGHLAGHPLDDPRVVVHQQDIRDLVRNSTSRYDAIMNDVDNGPQGIILNSNNWLYSEDGLHATRRAIRPGGILSVWSVGSDRQFTRRMQKAGFDAREEIVRNRGGSKGQRHFIWIGQRK
jgi:spermidine synthase